jgi:predicted nucleic acid-binding protein
MALVGLGLSYRISVRDAAYLWLAADLKAPLVTFDAKLARAARRHLGSDD